MNNCLVSLKRRTKRAVAEISQHDSF